MTNADWWARVVQARTRHADLLLQRVWALRKDGHEAAIDLRAVPGMGAELVFLGGRRVATFTLYRAHEQPELSGAIADTRATFEGKGGREGSAVACTPNAPSGQGAPLTHVPLFDVSACIYWSNVVRAGGFEPPTPAV